MDAKFRVLKVSLLSAKYNGQIWAKLFTCFIKNFLESFYIFVEVDLYNARILKCLTTSAGKSTWNTSFQNVRKP